MFRIAVDDVVEVPVRFSLRVKNVDKPMSCTLIARRVGDDAYAGRSPMDILRENVTGWKEQKLVLDASDNPAEFSSEAFEAMLNVPGLALTIWKAYQRETAAKEKN